MHLLTLRFLRAGLVAGFGIALLSTALDAQRLGQNVKPEHYTLTLTPDLKAATFAGVETIDVELGRAAEAITLNALEIKFQSVTAKVDGEVLSARVEEDTRREQVTFDFGKKLPAGKLSLSIRYTGILNGKLHGFYLSKTAKRNYAVTQFESTDARRAFPCFDEPALKATYSVTLVVDKGDTAISNTNILRDEPVAGTEKHAITFAVTPRMSTYLVAFVVGDFQCLSGESDGVPIRACATPDQVQYGKFALAAAEYDLHYYDTYFGIKYPMPKLDMIALPDFEVGAMENFGAITYRETDFLLDSDHASVGEQKEVAVSVAHEMAHQWFGDMVTMQWWDNLWLNEGFATWMENKPLEAWKPEWNMSQEVVHEKESTLNYDAQKTTHTIRARADTPDEINEMFDAISYGKAGAVLLMVENYLGEEVFRQGVHKYLTEHAYGNASAEDFWTALAAVSHKPVDKIMNSFVSLPGMPILTFGAAADGKVPVTQERFFLNGKTRAEKPETWTLPVCFKTQGAPRCEVVSSGSAVVPVPAAQFFFANAGGEGYYRVSYPEDVYSSLLAHVETELSPEERISLIGDEWALMRNGKATVGAFLDLALAVREDANPEVLNSGVGNLDAIDARIAGTPEEHAELAAWIRAHFSAIYKKLGDPQPGDSSEKRELRASLLGIVASYGEDRDAIAQAETIAKRSLVDPAGVDQTLAQEALQIAARYGDAGFFDQLQKLSTTATNPQLRSNSLFALAAFRDPVLARSALDFAVSGEVRNQDAISLFATELDSRENQDMATASGEELVGATSAFCTAGKLEQVTSFFGTHKVPATEQALAQAKERIADCIDLRAAQEGNLREWLAKQ
jgi:aminopeptidase N/puromycin-sensitive aminopeptidase